MSLLRFSIARRNILPFFHVKAPSYEFMGRNTSCMFSSFGVSVSAGHQLIVCGLRRGNVSRASDSHFRRCISTSCLNRCEAKTIRIVEYISEQHQPKGEIHADLSNVLQTRISQLEHNFNGEKIFSVPKQHSTKIAVAEETAKSAIKTKTSTKEDAVKKKTKTTKVSTKVKTKNVSAASKKNTTLTSKQSKLVSKPKTDQSKSKTKSSRSPAVKRVEKDEPLKDRTTEKTKSLDTSSKNKRTVKSKSSNKGASKTAKKESVRERGKSSTSTLDSVQSQSVQNASSELKSLSSKQSQSTLASRSTLMTPTLKASSSSSMSPLSLSPSSSLLSEKSTLSSKPEPLMTPTFASDQSELIPSSDSTPSSKQLHNLNLAIRTLPSNLARGTENKQLASTKSSTSSSNVLSQKHHDLKEDGVDELRPTSQMMMGGLSQHTFDLDNEDVFEQDMQLLDVVSGKSPGSIESAIDKSAIRKKGTWKKVRRKQFTEDAESYLRPYMEASVYSDNIEAAQSLMFAFEKLNGQVQVDDYNTLIQAWARKGKWDEVRHLLARMVSKNVTSDRQTYAASLECLARCEEPDLKIVQKGLEQMEKDGITLDDVLSFGSYSGEGRHLVIKLIQRLLPSFEPPGPGIKVQCTTTIVEDLYSGASASGKGSSLLELMSREDLERKIRQQWDMELAETVTVTSVEEIGELDAVTAHRRKLLNQHRVQWRRSLKRALENEKTRQYFKFKSPNFSSICYYPFLILLQPDEYVDLMLQSLSNLSSTTEGSMTISLARDLSTKLHRKYSIRAKLKQGNAQQIKELYEAYVLRTAGDQETSFELPRESFQELEDRMLGSSSLDQGFQAKVWPTGMLIGIGTLLADMMLREIKIDANMNNNKPEKQLIPALYHMYTYRSFKHVGFIKPHPSLVDLFQTAKDPNLVFDTNMLPMLTPPIPWTSVRFGAYPLSSTKIMRSKDGAHQHQDLLEKTPSQELYPILDALNQLSTVPWIINKPVLDTVISVFRNNGSKDLDVPQPASACPLPPRITSDISREELAQVHRERAAARKLQAEMHSLRMDMLYKLSIADKVRDEIVWFPHNMDFRGRVYPCPPHFNHFGSDVTRSLLLFARGRPLGEEGFRWLKIHLVNLTGHKKRCAVEERLQYAHDMMDEIIDSADRPLDGNKWWQESDEQWQTLASCMEVTKAIRSGDPASYVSHLPIHQDGSCNGLQHYAALGRDLVGAQQVNLHPFDVPQDVYSGVAQMVEELRRQDAEKGNKIAQALAGHIKRNVVKQTVMTVVYGVTSYGGRRQILKQLREEDDLTMDQKWFAAGYITLKVFQSLRKMFTKTREIQDWLTESAWLISKAGETVEWVTPLGLPIIQPYHKKSLKLISHGGRNVYHEDRNSQNERPDTMKQKNAFPPNFIHSLDSTHMMLTSLYSQRAGITFASVHDCYWTHASSVNQMNKICRNQFVKLHKEPILDNLAEFMVEKYGPLEMQDTSKLKRGSRNMKIIEDYVKNVPQKGEFDLDNVLKSTYFFS
ncbi:DNA-directed RNA polymerase, mitochondrial-like isoform X1 [Lytechinus variegatus]|uniref:DNA-directed RNA polymerase, mitochondrial-like isoform X1 n=1 Tax=Lytechinus variegatus TaxID=7654 RepID=UPI001BB10378|nr:DNA-directed RNA polymerase, mitochondrial-like isoform X1 [Lytechinus variegatus]